MNQSVSTVPDSTVPEHEIKNPFWKSPGFWLGALTMLVALLDQLKHVLPANSQVLPYVGMAFTAALLIKEAIVGQSRNAASAVVEAARVTNANGGLLGQIAESVAPVAASVSDAATSVQGAAANVEGAARDVADVADSVTSVTQGAQNFSLDEIVRAASTAASKATIDQFKKEGKIQ